jgi:hypothetical protein
MIDSVNSGWEGAERYKCMLRIGAVWGVRCVFFGPTCDPDEKVTLSL